MDEKSNPRRSLPDHAETGHWIAKDGWPIRTLRLRAAAAVKGSILFAGGRADFIEKYQESLIHWRDRGWDVTAFDWRGQGGSGRLVRDGLKPGVVGHAEDFAGWIDDLARLVDDWRASSAGPHMLIGHSMGGHLMLRYVAERAPSVAGLVLSSPMIGFRTPLPEGLVRRIAASMVRNGKAKRFAWGQNARPAVAHSVRQRRLTSDVERYADELWWNAAHPEHVLGGASWGWINAAYRSRDILAASGVAEGITVPVLLVATVKDRVVDTRRAVSLVNRIPDHEIALFSGGHELLRERDEIRHAVWERIDRFMEERARC